jgi:hypothetical protein
VDDIECGEGVMREGGQRNAESRSQQEPGGQSLLKSFLFHLDST